MGQYVTDGPINCFCPSSQIKSIIYPYPFYKYHWSDNVNTDTRNWWRHSKNKLAYHLKRLKERFYNQWDIKMGMDKW
jgi:hypothetical protein